MARSTEALADDPLREPAVFLAMRALAATGRSPDALRTADEFRRRLADESGLDASPALGALEREIAQGHGAGDAAASTSPPRVPSPATAIVGRDSEIAALRRLLADERLVTVVGPGGVGKTRLALELARRSEAPTVLMLAPVTDPAAIPHALAECLGLHITHGDVLRACIALLGSGPRILIVDNCEHVLDAARDLVAALLADCPELTILATSREPLGLAPETLVRLAPLALPAAEAIELAGVPSIAVFVDRARRVRPDFAPDAEALRRVGEIVRRLDGMPLAIELAAGRLSSFGLDDLHDRIGRSFDILGDGRASPDARHRTLRTTVQWSYDLLPDDEARFFCHLAVFPDGVDLPTAEAVAADLGIADAPTTLAHLVDASILVAEFGEVVRYRMLEMLRAFGVAQLESAGELAAAEERLLRWAVEVATHINQRSATDDEPESHRHLGRELPTLRAAWHLARGHGRLDHAVALVVNLEYPAFGTDLTEILHWAIELVDEDDVRDHHDYGTVVGMAAMNLWVMGDLARADALARHGLAVATANTGRQWCLSALSGVDIMSGRFDDTVTHALESASRSTTPAEDFVMAALGSLYAGHVSPARAFAQHAVAVATCPSQRGIAAYTTGEIESASGNGELAEAHYLRAIALATESGHTFTRGIASVGLLTVLTSTGRIDDALVGYGELIDDWERGGNWTQLWTTLRNLAGLLRSLDDCETALFLETAADVAPESSEVGEPVWNAEQPGVPLEPSTITRVRGEAESASRSDVLEVARQSIARHRAADGAP